MSYDTIHELEAAIDNVMRDGTLSLSTVVRAFTAAKLQIDVWLQWIESDSALIEPFAWVRAHPSHPTPGGDAPASDYAEEVVIGAQRPEGDDWFPVYRWRSPLVRQSPAAAATPGNERAVPECTPGTKATQNPPEGTIIGEPCPMCRNFTMVDTGTCLTCASCGETTGVV